MTSGLVSYTARDLTSLSPLYCANSHRVRTGCDGCFALSADQEQETRHYQYHFNNSGLITGLLMVAPTLPFAATSTVGHAQSPFCFDLKSELGREKT